MFLVFSYIKAEKSRQPFVSPWTTYPGMFPFPFFGVCERGREGEGGERERERERQTDRQTDRVRERERERERERDRERERERQTERERERE